MTVTDGQKAVNLRIQGRVQGVGFRAWTVARAEALGLSGWVRNRRDGSVEALVSGSTEAVGRMIAACQAGPSYARVTGVATTPAEPPDEPGFHELPTV